MKIITRKSPDFVIMRKTLGRFLMDNNASDKALRMSYAIVEFVEYPGMVTESQEQMARFCRVSRPTANAGLQELCKMGVIYNVGKRDKALYKLNNKFWRVEAQKKEIEKK